jgi:hypothetical protein
MWEIMNHAMEVRAVDVRRRPLSYSYAQLTINTALSSYTIASFGPGTLQYTSPGEAVQSLSGGREDLLPRLVHYGGHQLPTPPEPHKSRAVRHAQLPLPATFDTSGQIAPPGQNPRVTATLWEDEGSLCFQVEAKGVCVARREDNHMINGTKLLNVAGMTRARRDGILKAEKTRHVVKIGPMHLKGVW